VTSVIGRFLEHSRVYYFRNGAADEVDGQFFIGSADWMYRNLLARVEAVVPIERRGHRERLWEVLRTMLADQRQAWDMKPDGSYVQRKPTDPAAQAGTHATLMSLTRHATAAAGAKDGKK
jgi:polyphosphate kinase